MAKCYQRRLFHRCIINNFLLRSEILINIFWLNLTFFEKNLLHDIIKFFLSSIPTKPVPQPASKIFISCMFFKKIYSFLRLFPINHDIYFQCPFIIILLSIYNWNFITNIFLGHLFLPMFKTISSKTI